MSTSQQPVSGSASESPTTPARLAGLTLPHPPADAATTEAGKEPTTSVAQAASQEFSSFMSLVHSYLWSSITLADQKAAFVFAADSAFLGYLLSNGMLRQLGISALRSWRLPQWLAVVSLAFLGVSIGAAVDVVMPRLGGKSSGLIYFKAIAARKSAERYVVDVLSATTSSLNIALSEHSYEIATIAAKKYRHLRFAMWVGILGFVAGLVFVGLRS